MVCSPHFARLNEQTLLSSFAAKLICLKGVMVWSGGFECCWGGAGLLLIRKSEGSKPEQAVASGNQRCW